MATLWDAYCAAWSTLKPQKQGTCGLYSFWYASLLLSQLDPNSTRPIIYPRKGEGTGTLGISLRRYAKSIGSGQGEVLSALEMENIIKKFKFQFATNVGPKKRKQFITDAMGKNRPVLIPYMMGDTGPISSFPVGAVAGTDYGPHWSLIIAESEKGYVYIEPNNPNTVEHRTKESLLASNSFVDSYKYDRFWSKGSTDVSLPYHQRAGISPVGNTKTTDSYYDIGRKYRQKLADILIAVF